MTTTNKSAVGKHTPGPWVKVGRLEVRAYGLVATVNEHNTINGEPEANASLIASAPELLEACKSALSVIESAVGSDLIPASYVKKEVSELKRAIKNATI